MLTATQRDRLEDWVDVDPCVVALKTGDGELARVVEGLKKAKTKVPSYYNARCEVEAVMVEQATNEVVALSRNLPKGTLAIDLTCGMGVDSLALSRCFEQVVAIEIDEKRTGLTSHNFRLLGVDNVTVTCNSAEAFLENFEGVADLIFCDPSRRTIAGKRLYSLEDCTPNIVDLMEVMLKKGRRVCVKLSPLFDVGELFRIFSNASVEVISQNNECKEVVLHIGHGVERGKIINTIIKGDTIVRCEFDNTKSTDNHNVTLTNPTFVYQPDVAFYKSRTVEKYLTSSFPETNYHYSNYVFTDAELPNFVGKTRKIVSILPYQPKKLKKFFKEQTIKSITIIRRDFIDSSDLILKQLGVKEGNGATIVFCRLNGENMAILTE